MTAHPDSVSKFDPRRAAEYEAQSRIALAGYDACHELAACMLAAKLDPDRRADILVAGAGGTANEIIVSARLEPKWRFMAVDPSRPMLDLALARVKEKGLADRTRSHLGYVEDLPRTERFDAATLIGVLHHLPGDEAKRDMLRALAERLKPGAPLILAGNRFAYSSQPLLLAAWGERWRMHGATAEEVKVKLARILEGADPPHSEEAVAALLAETGFGTPLRFFSSLFWAAWITIRLPD